MFRRSIATLILALLTRLLAAQGVMTAAIQGTVSSVDGSAIDRATIQLTNAASGLRWLVATGSDGRFLLEAVTIGTYRVEARALGFVTEVRTGIVLGLGQRLVTEFRLRPGAIELAPVVVSARADPVLDHGRTGPAEIISRQSIVGLPNPARNFFNLTLLSPNVVSSPQTPAVPTGGIAIGGQNRLYNSFQIDGGVHHDPYRGELPGRQSLPRPLSLESLEEIQVLTAPFDVRHGSFVGGLVNAVTRSGTNAVHGSLFGNLADGALVRPRGIGGQVGDFTTWQFGGTIGGPIVRDRAHYFVSVDLQELAVPDPGPVISDTTGGSDSTQINISYASAVRLRTILDTLYGLDAGSFGPVRGQTPAQDVFGKITVQLATNSHLEWSYHYAHGNRRDFLLRTQNYYALSSRVQEEPSTAHASRLMWSGLVGGRWSNELMVSYLRLTDECSPGATFPQLRVFVGPVAFLDVGNAGVCPPSTVRQDIIEATNSATYGFGRHAVTLGVHGELLRFRDDQIQNSPGLWLFSALDSLEARRARLYQRALRGPSWNGGVDFRGLNVGVYAQDRWSPTPSVTVTLGLRLDVPTLPDAVPTNAALRDSLGINTGRLPSGNLLWSPRLGINYDVGGAGRTFIRGGVGLFSGRPPYRWLSNAYRDDGTQELVLDCRGNEVPVFDPSNQPSSCVTRGPIPQVSFFDPQLRFPQSLKVALGLDQRLPGPLVGTVDLLYTRTVHQLYLTDANLQPPSGVSVGEGGRLLYGAINPANGNATPARVNGGFERVIRVSNQNGDDAFSITAQLRTRFGGAVEGSILYAYGRARDRMWLAHFPARALLEGTVLDGPLAHRRLAPAFHDIPHRVQLITTVQLPYRASLALVYSGASGRPFTYTVAGDANADGLAVNLRQDAAYVPRDRADITIDANGGLAGLGTLAGQDSAYAALDAFIRSVPCLREQRGRIVARNSCRNPWFGTLNARLTKALPTAAGRSIDVAVDLYNVLNLLNSNWGISRYDGLTFGTDLVVLRGYDTTAGRGIYEFRLPPRNQVDDLVSRWQMEISVRYVF